MGLSLSSILPSFGFSRMYFGEDFVRQLPFALRFLTAAQTILALPLLFFLALGLRTRFRLR